MVWVFPSRGQPPPRGLVKEGVPGAGVPVLVFQILFVNYN